MGYFFKSIMASFLFGLHAFYAAGGEQTIVELPLPKNLVAKLPDGSIVAMMPDRSEHQGEDKPLRYYEVLQLYTGRARFDCRGGGYHEPIRYWQEKYFKRIKENPSVCLDQDVETQAILCNLKQAVSYCNVMYKK